MSLAALAIQAVSGLATVAALFLTDEAGLRTVLALELSAQGGAEVGPRVGEVT